MAARGQALIEYVLILTLAFLGVLAILLLTAPAAGNVFSNTVYNLLGQTTTPQEPLNATQFWQQVTAVASYTPQTPVDVVTHTPLPLTGSPADSLLKTPTPTMATDTPTRTPTPGPSATPSDTIFPYPFEDDGGNPDNWQPDPDLFGAAGPWDAEYWDRHGSGPGQCNNGNFIFAPDGTPSRPAKAILQVERLHFPDAELPTNYWSDGDGRPHPNIDLDFCSRFVNTMTIESGPYTFRYRKDEGIQIIVIDEATGNVDRVVDDWNWGPNGESPVSVDWTNATTGEKTVVLLHRDIGGFARLEASLFPRGLESDPDCTWQISAERYNSPPTAWNDSPYTNYLDDQRCVLRLRGAIDLSGAVNPVIEFYDAYDLDKDYDYVNIGISIYGSGEWNDYQDPGGNPLHVFETNYSFERHVIDLTRFPGTQGTTNYAGQLIEIRLVIQSDTDFDTGEGWWFDDLYVHERTERVFTIGFADNVEGEDNWVGDGGWARTTEDSHTPTHSWTDSPGSNYSPQTDTSLELDGRLDLTQGTVNNPQIAFWHKWDLGAGGYTYLELSTDRETWTPLRTGPSDTTDYLEFNSSQPAFVQEVVDIPTEYWELDRIYVRFHLRTTNQPDLRDGWHVDDIEFRNKIITVIEPNWCDNMESGSGNWIPGGDWALTNLSAHGGLQSWTDSPGLGVQYLDGSETWLELLPYVSLATPGLTRPVLEFWHHWDISGTHDYSADAIVVEISLDDGNTWQSVWAYASEPGGNARPPSFGSSVQSGNHRYNINRAWAREVIDLTPYLGFPNLPGDPEGFRLRFRLDARSNPRVGDGWYIDDVCIQSLVEDVVTLPFADDLERGVGNWYLGGNWERANEDTSHSGSFVLSDSVGGDFEEKTFHIIELRPTFDLTGTTSPTLYYWERYDVANRNYRVNAQIQEVDVNGTALTDWEVLDGTEHAEDANLGWIRTEADLRPYTDSNVRIRFQLDGLYQDAPTDGWYIDDVSLIDRDDTLYTDGEYHEDVEDLEPGEWVFEHQWEVVQVWRNVGSGSGLGPGQWTGTWYDNVFNACATSLPHAEIDLASEVNTLTYDEIDFNWGNGLPAGSGITDADVWGGIFTRTVVFPQDTAFRFVGVTNNGIRVFDNGNLIYQENWVGCAELDYTSEPYTFTAGIHDIEVHFYENTGSARLTLGMAGVSNAFHDSPVGSYQHRTDTSLELEGRIDLSAYTAPVLFWGQVFNLERNETISIAVSTDEGFTWENIYSRGRGTDWNWTKYFVDLSPYAEQEIVIRFRLDARSDEDVADGWWIDNIQILD